MEPLTLGALVGISTILVLFSGVSVAIGLLIVSAAFLMIFDGMGSLELMPELLFGKLDSFALLSIPMFIIMGASIRTAKENATPYAAKLYLGSARRAIIAARKGPSAAIISQVEARGIQKRKIFL